MPLPSQPPETVRFDPISTPANVQPMLDLYDRAEVETRWVDPSDLNVSTVGHLSFFRSDVGRPLWDEALDWLVHRA